MIKNFQKLSFKRLGHQINVFHQHQFCKVRSFATESAPATSLNTELKWQLVAAACITRTPIISPEMKPIEKDYNTLSEKLEFEKSYKSDHELRLLEEKMRVDLINIGEHDSVELEDTAKQTGAEIEDKSLEEFKAFKFADRLTDADRCKDLSSLNRALDRSLMLTMKQKLGSQSHWMFPQTPWNPGETLRQSSERVVRNICGTRLKVKFLGNSPCGFFKYKYPKEVRKQGFIGAKVFFFAGHVVAFDSEGLEKSSEFEHLWLTQEELESKLGKSYYQAVSQFLIGDE